MGTMDAADRGPQLAAVAILFLVLAWIAVSMRVYVRLVIIKSFGNDDWLAVISLALFTLYCTCVLMGIKYGTGQHLTNLPLENIPKAFKWWWLCELTYVSSTAIFKASICVFLMRICTKRSQIYAIWVVIVLVTLYSTFYLFFLVFQCKPISYFWTRFEGAPGKCVSPKWITDITYAHSGVSAASDWTIGILPIFLVWDLKMNPRTKISVALILALGAFGSTATIVRIPFLHQLMNTTDFLYVTVDVAIWSTVEPGIGITCAAIACLRPLIRNFLSRSQLWGTTTGNKSRTIGWPTNFIHNGYMRSGLNDVVDIGFRNEFSIQSHVSETLVQNQLDHKIDDLEMGSVMRVHGNDSTKNLHNGSGWRMSDSKLEEERSDEDVGVPTAPPSGRISIKTTTVVSSSPKSQQEEASMKHK